MKIIFLKRYINNEAGAVREFADAVAAKLIKWGVAKAEGAAKELKNAVETKEEKVSKRATKEQK